jgi:hypothetical protein
LAACELARRCAGIGNHFRQFGHLFDSGLEIYFLQGHVKGNHIAAVSPFRAARKAFPFRPVVIDLKGRGIIPVAGVLGQGTAAFQLVGALKTRPGFLGHGH